jgi:hypothetical protein
MSIEVKLKGDVLSIYIDSLPHLIIRKSIIGFQAWNRENRWWEIEFYLKDQKILTQYDDSKKWSEILKQLNLLFL